MSQGHDFEDRGYLDETHGIMPEVPMFSHEDTVRWLSLHFFLDLTKDVDAISPACTLCPSTLDLLVTAGRNACAQLWDMHTKAQIHVLSSHMATVADVKCQESEPQVITGSMDSTVRQTRVILTPHKKLVCALAIHPTEYSFASGSASSNNIKKWKCLESAFVFNFSGHNAIINADGVFFSGADNGSLSFWDYNTGTSFQNMEDVPQPGSLDAEAGVFCSTFEMTGMRLITGGADKMIKIYAEQSQ
ncbi:Pre-mRNA-splicing factor PRP46 [Mycena venus]|uniref:Pre-mRNA-splicing factor PRP46 n=1 Tax=Mycena venus TaxID=2733690 RepID=A0A8H6X464_9AGAR|nr:Pre-mRNA-splicing factor PRP46 [Mycena venus]